MMIFVQYITRMTRTSDPLKTRVASKQEQGTVMLNDAPSEDWIGLLQPGISSPVGEFTTSTLRFQ